MIRIPFRPGFVMEAALVAVMDVLHQGRVRGTVSLLVLLDLLLVFDGF